MPPVIECFDATLNIGLRPLKELMLSVIVILKNIV
jgi:hypothetical protein